MEALFEFLDDSMIYLAFQEDEVPGNWNWQQDPPEETKVVGLSEKYFSKEPFIYLLTGQ